MIHHHECERCTHQWCSSCMGEMLTKPEDRERNSRQTFSHLCWDCFEKLENGDFGIELREIYYLYHKLMDRNFHSEKLELIKQICTLTNTPVQGVSQEMLNEHSRELQTIVNSLSEIYNEEIKKTKTPARIELDRLQDEHRKQQGGFNFAEFYNGGWRPDGFVGDGPGKPREEVLFGLELSSGDILAPHIRINSGESCELNKEGV